MVSPKCHTAVTVGLVGVTGQIGKALLKQLTAQASALEPLLNCDLRVCAVCNSTKMLFSAAGLSPASVPESLKTQGEEVNLAVFGDKLADLASQRAIKDTGMRPPCAIVVDCTASDAAPSMYLQWMESGLHIVTPNKKFGSGDLERYQALKALSHATGRQFLAEASVGAGLPVLSTLRTLVETGDQITKVEGVLSGTLSWIFNTYKPGMSFASVVSEAKQAGYTEPDPREDLSGMDVARKVVILARGCGVDATLESLQVESLVPDALCASSISAEQYLEALPQHDAPMAARADAAEAVGEVIRYVGSVDVRARKASVALTRVPKDHYLAQLKGTDNVISFTTKRYHSNPLVVRGPGAGPEVTASGVFADIIQAVRSHGNSC